MIKYDRTWFPTWYFSCQLRCRVLNECEPFFFFFEKSRSIRWKCKLFGWDHLDSYGILLRFFLFVTGPPRDCRVSDWSEWTRCSKSCDIGESTRIRKVIHHSRRGGRPCPPLTEKKWCGSARSCNRRYFNWSKWSINQRQHLPEYCPFCNNLIGEF